MNGSAGAGESTAPWPSSVCRVASALAILHLVALGLHVFGNRSGPWAVAGNFPVRQPSPPFVHLPVARAAAEYLGALRLDETGRFPALFASGAVARLEALDPSGGVVATLPDPAAWAPVRQRQQVLANALLTDVAALPDSGGERSYLEGQLPLRPVWRIDGAGTTLKLFRVPDHELARDPNRREQGPTDWQIAVARSYAARMGGPDATLRRCWTLPLPLVVAMSPAAANAEIARSELADTLAERRSEYGNRTDAAH